MRPEGHVDVTSDLKYSYSLMLTSPNAPLPITFKESKSSMPSRDLFSRKNSVSFCACNALLSSFYRTRVKILMKHSFPTRSIHWCVRTSSTPLTNDELHRPVQVLSAFAHLHALKLMNIQSFCWHWHFKLQTSKKFSKSN
jgi:hypothetical protein